MHILFILPYAPSPVRVRSYQFARALLRRGHHITLAAPLVSDADAHALEVMRAAGAAVLARPLGVWQRLWNCATALPGGEPLQAAFAWQPTLAVQIGERLRSGGIDVVHVEHLRGARYLRSVRDVLPLGVPLVWDAVDSITHLFEQTIVHSIEPQRRRIARFELARTRRWEALLLQQVTHAATTSAVDRAALLREAGPGAAPVTVIPNGVDLRMFRPAAGCEPEADTVVFSGRMSYHANVAAAVRLARDIFPRVRAVRPHARLVIVGRDPTPAVCALARQVAGVTVTGAVDDLAEHLRRAAVSAAPLVYGAGVQNKVLEALACGTPVVADPLAMRALDASACDVLLVAEDDGAFAAQILRLFDDAALRRRLSRTGRAFVEQHHTWDGAAAVLEKIYLSRHPIDRRGLALAGLT